MKVQILICLLLGLAMVKAEDQTENIETDNAVGQSEKIDDEPKIIVEDSADETSALLEAKTDDQHKKGFCHWGIAVWFKAGHQIRCSCMKCVCLVTGKWHCMYHFAYCPYYYCGGKIYNPQNQLCCCGKIYKKRRYFSCCGYFYYNTLTSKCCSYFTVKPKRANCPRFTIGQKG